MVGVVRMKGRVILRRPGSPDIFRRIPFAIRLVGNMKVGICT